MGLLSSPNTGRLGLMIAFRYFRGKKSVQAINIISWISIGAVTLLATSMIVLMSVFNGFEDLLKDLYKAFYPELKISPSSGKWFEVTAAQQQQIRQVKGVEGVSLSAEDMVLLSANEEQRIAVAKGVDDSWFRVNSVDSFIDEGQKNLEGYGKGYIPAIVGNTLCAGLGIDVRNVFAGMQIHYPKPGTGFQSPEQLFSSLLVKPAGRFRVQEDFDARYVLIPLQEAQQLFNTGSKVSSVELKLTDAGQEAQVVRRLREIFAGNNITIDNRYQQNKTLYMIMQSEKWAGFVILMFVLLIASFTMIGVLSMLVLDKKKDIAILKSMGGTQGMIRSVFIAEGALFGIAGGGIGLIAGFLLCKGQQHFGWIPMGDGFIIESYPVSMHAGDFVTILIATAATGILTALHPAFKASSQKLYFREE